MSWMVSIIIRYPQRLRFRYSFRARLDVDAESASKETEDQHRSQLPAGSLRAETTHRHFPFAHDRFSNVESNNISNQSDIATAKRIAAPIEQHWNFFNAEDEYYTAPANAKLSGT